MKVKQLKIKSFRGFDDLILDFDPDEPTVFIGVNGSGKSSILDCLSILLSWLLKRIGSPKSSVQGQFFKEIDIKNKHKSTYNTIAIDFDDSTEVTWSLSKTRRGSIQESVTDVTQLKKVVEKIHNQLDINPEDAIPLAVYYPTKRAVIDIPLRIKIKHSFEQIKAYDQALENSEIDFRMFFEWFRKREDLENEQRRNENSLIQIVRVLKKGIMREANIESFLASIDINNYKDLDKKDQIFLEILKDKKDPETISQLINKYNLDPQLETVRQAIYQILDGFTNLRVKRSPLQMTVNKNGKELIINQLSDGEKCLLAMVGDLARRLAMANPGLENKLEGKGVVLIDEIELHLHPQWQRKIIPRLTKTFPNCQFIITTHSPQVISDVKWVHLIMENESGSLIVEKVRTYGKDSNLILETLMKTSERSQEGVEDFHKLFELIDEGKLNEAKEWKEKLIQKMGEEDPQFVKAGWLIRKIEIMKDEANSEDTTAERIH